MPKPEEFKISRNSKLLFREDSNQHDSNIHKGIETQRSSQTVKEFFYKEVHESFKNDSSSSEEMDGDLDEGYAINMDKSNPENTPELRKLNNQFETHKFSTVVQNQNDSNFPSNDKFLNKNNKSAKHKKNLTGPKQKPNFATYNVEEIRNEGK